MPQLFKTKLSKKLTKTKSQQMSTCKFIDYSHIVLIIAIWPGDRIRRQHSTVEHGTCDESV